MAIRSKSGSADSSTGIIEAPNGEREQVFDAFRRWGYLEADLDPLGFFHPAGSARFADRRRICAKRRGGFIAARSAWNSCTFPSRNAAAGSRSGWKRRRLQVDQQRVLDQLIRADLFEQVLQQRYLGSKRFSLEGVTALIPLLDECSNAPASMGAIELVMGMSHRGRLNVMVHRGASARRKIFSRDSKMWTRAACWAAAT